MGKVAALVLTEEEKTWRDRPSQLVRRTPITVAIPLPPTFVGTFPSGKVFGCPKRRMHNRNHPTSDNKLRWLFIKCRRFCRTWCSTIESVEAVQNGAPPKPNEVGLVGRGGAAERLSFCPERQNEGCGACDDEARLSPPSFAVQRKMGPTECVG